MTSVLRFHHIDENEGLQKLNTHLFKNSYIFGFHPTKLDCSVLEKLDNYSESCEYPHIARWWRQINSYSLKERNQWEVPASMEIEVTRKNCKTVCDEADDFDPFGEETQEEKIAAEKVSCSGSKAAKPKKTVINKSQLVIDVKPASIDINLDTLESLVRNIFINGLEWSLTCKKVPIAFGLMKLQIGCVIVDDLVNTDDIIERIECLGLTEEEMKKRIALRDAGEEDEDELEGMVQSAEIVSFNKL